MELHIETLTGSSMILHVSPLDTVFDVKTYIQKLEGMVTAAKYMSLEMCLYYSIINKPAFQ